ncbi:hypothetical protein EOD41_09360 [Mucilaginibacter limnophilus]|uniref:Uncharacterized protein n=1 Tax=Mucilaginibacter limnophilus TaxID=1932778 RepID=A0A3S2UP02_9SPHI|nr:hypothetical protein [Mucilaginibacter limnophilus]RVU00834.1 hypothetical protein EOD41_09360 [Mucilaginibacter limnophilus]
MRNVETKKRAKRTGWIIFAFLIIFALIIIRFAMSGAVGDSFFSGMPSKSDAYDMAQQFVRPALRGSDVEFSDQGFQFGKQSDSVYVIKSYAETETGDDEKQRIDFTVIMKYKGGPASYKSNWELQSMNIN